jgi:hypothetical protein
MNPFGLKKVSEEIVTIDGKVKKIEKFERVTCLTTLKEREEEKLQKIESEIASV